MRGGDATPSRGTEDRATRWFPTRVARRSGVASATSLPGGDFTYNGGEWVGTSSVDGAWTTTAQSMSGTGVRAASTCVQMADTRGRMILPKIGPRVRVDQPSQSNCKINDRDSYCSSKTALPQDNGICALSRVGGKLRGGGEAVYVSSSRAGWSVDLYSANDKGVHGAAQCLYF